MSFFIHQNISIEKNNKGRCFICKNFIPKGTMVVKETPFVHFENRSSFRTIYESLMKDEKKYNQLSPHNKDKHFFKYEDIIQDLLNENNTIIDYFINMDPDELVLLYMKYVRNGFKFGKGECILLIGTIFNHSCVPNIGFEKITDTANGTNVAMHFITLRDIFPGEELFDNYVDTEDKNRRKKLLKFYGFLCDCNKCKK